MSQNEYSRWGINGYKKERREIAEVYDWHLTASKWRCDHLENPLTSIISSIVPFMNSKTNVRCDATEDEYRFRHGLPEIHSPKVKASEQIYYP